MAVSVRLEPLLEKELELTAKRLGVTKSQFIISALEKALGRKNPYELLLKVQADAESDPRYTELNQAFVAESAAPYDTERSRQALIAQLRAKHGLSPD